MELKSRLSGRWVGKDGTLDPRKRQWLRLAGLALIVLGAVPLAQGGGPAVVGVKAPGQVVEILEQPKQGRGRRYDAVIDFVAADGRAVRIRRPFQHRGSRSLEVGEQVTVAYLRGRAEGAEVQDRRARWAAGVTPVFVGILLTAVSFAGGRPPTDGRL